MKVIKRDGRKVDFNREKIVVAIEKAMKYGSGVYDIDVVEDVADDIEAIAEEVGTLSIFQIENIVYNKLVQFGHAETARAYEGYRAVQEYKRESNTTDDSIIGLLNQTNSDLMNENSNKNAVIASTQRDLVAGIVSKDIARRKLIPTHLVQAHDEGAVHIHDLDYIMQPIFNCCIINLKDMLDNGTVINGKMVEAPKSFQVACTVTTQIVAQVASNQYGGQSLGMLDTVLAPYARKSYDKYYEKHLERLQNLDDNKTESYIKGLAGEYADQDMRKEISDGIQTIQYQINTLMTTNGQAPFLTISMYFDPEGEYAYEAAIIQEEILKQRLEGIKNEAGIISTPAFPKLVYFTDDHNVHKDSDYYYLTELAAKCTAKRLYPDYISMKKMRELYEGNVITPMGCRAFLPPYMGTDGYQVDGRFNIGVTTINLPQIAILSKGDKDMFYNILNDRLNMAREMGMVRYNLLKDVPSDVSPIHWQHGAIARMEKGEKIGSLFKDKYATVTVGYIGMYEVAQLMFGKSNTSEEGREFTLEVLQFIKDKLGEWYEDTGIYFATYGTPSEATAGRLCNIDREKFGDIENVTDKGYYINSFHVDVREDINAFDKLKFESDYQDISTGGCISYIEIPNMTHNKEAILEVIQYMYDEITYAEFNTKSDNCHVCKYEGEITLNKDLTWECPQCHNKDKDQLTVVRRTCGYLGENYWSEARTKDIKDRVLHL